MSEIHTIFTPQSDYDKYKNYRLSLPLGNRILLISSACSLVTFTLGATHGARKTSYQFLAENAHRLPRTHQGWYFYHKTKNYRVMQGGIRAGMKYAGRTLLWTSLYIGLEGVLDAVRGRIDALDSLVSATITGAIFSSYHSFSRQLMRRTVRMSALTGLGLGLLQDALIYAKGGEVWYYNILR